MVNYLAYSPDGKRLATAGLVGTARVFRAGDIKKPPPDNIVIIWKLSADK
jgi:hypothetical protein